MTDNLYWYIGTICSVSFASMKIVFGGNGCIVMK